LHKQRLTAPAFWAGVWRSLSWCLESVMLWAVAWHYGLCEIWRQVCQWFRFALRLCSWSRILAPGNSMQADLHTPRFPYVLIICSLPVLFVCNAFFLFLLLYFHMHKPQTNLVNVCTQLVLLRNEQFLGDTFDVLCSRGPPISSRSFRCQKRTQN